ncbi:hypothetical protein [Lentilactobacillus hilgardii]|uniref:hypothetical protein n=1 Tax=Lentilactobacillus hilgardii TaxID=1588 RepID=UPI0021A35403|nr:hypothetical protein [Lentilactobacillus hilgardii]MCT3391420.1 hypothetical protein [Lentilactobacillus hilgardii]
MKLKIFVFGIAVFWGINVLVDSQQVNAAKIHYNHVPAVLNHNWISPLYRAKKSQRTPYNQYWYTNLSPSNTRFQLQDFVLNKNLGNNNNSGPYGAFKDYWALGYQKLSSHRYIIFGTLYLDLGSKQGSQYGVVLSKNYKNLKLFNFKVKIKHNYWYTGKSHYVGRFYRGISHYERN